MPFDRDIEMNILTLKEDSVAHGSSYSTNEPSYDEFGFGFGLDGPGGRRHSSSRRSHHQHHHHHHDLGGGVLGRWVDTFRRDPNNRVTAHLKPEAERDRLESLPSREHGGARYFDLHAANVATSNSSLTRALKARHLQMIAFGGSIGE